MGNFAKGTPEFSWFRSFIQLEAAFQLPVFVIGAYCLYHNYKSIYPILLIYAASSVTTQIPVFSYILSYNSLPAVQATPSLKLRPEQLAMLMSSYVPFFLAPFCMMVDMARRLRQVLKAAEGALDRSKKNR